jgi:hypothetical protein
MPTVRRLERHVLGQQPFDRLRLLVVPELLGLHMMPAHHVLSLDPSVVSPGAALWVVREGQSKLLGAARVPILEQTTISEAERWLHVADSVLAWVSGLAQILMIERQLRIATFVFERPQIYREAKSKGDHNQLIGLAAVGVALAARLQVTSPALVVLSPTPAEWSGQLPKTTRGDPWKSPRGQRVAGRLSPDELRLVPAQHDAIDAVGLGLWALGRFDRQRNWHIAR